ncbi:MAG TPA: hypothetical protein VGI99_00785 [Gemmataceae bacterium]
MIFLVVAAAAFIGWLSYLSYTALMKNRGPVVSRVQAAAAAHAVVVELSPGANGKPSPEAKIVESFTAGSPAAGTEIYVVNIADASGFEGPGEYLLLLGAGAKNQVIPIHGKDMPMFAVVGPQRSPGYEVTSEGHPLIYRMSEQVRSQAKSLFP